MKKDVERNTVEVKRRALALGFDAVGIATLEANAHAAELDRWLAAGYAGTMTYLHRQAEKRKDPPASCQTPRSPWSRLRTTSTDPITPGLRPGSVRPLGRWPSTPGQRTTMACWVVASSGWPPWFARSLPARRPAAMSTRDPSPSGSWPSGQGSAGSGRT